MSGTSLDFPGWYVSWQAAVLKQLPRPGEIDQETAVGWDNNQNALKKVLAGVLVPPTNPPQSHNIEGKFRFRTTIKGLKIPDNYVHEECLKTFVAEHGPGEDGKYKDKKLYYLNSNLTDKNFAKVTAKLLPGKEYDVDVYDILDCASSEGCLELSKKGKLVGAQGLAVLYKDEKVRGQLPKDRLALSLDEKDNLPQIDGNHQVPYLFCCFSDGDYRLSLYYWDDDWYDYFVVLVFRDCGK